MATMSRRVSMVRGALLAAAALALAGCAAPPPAPVPHALWRDASYPAPARPLPSADALFALSPPMEQFLRTQVGGLGGTNSAPDPRRALVEALYRPLDVEGAGLRLAYDASLTRNAAEAFEARAGNCLSLVMMTAALAQRLGLAVGYQRVYSDTSYSLAGTLTLASGHVNLVIGFRPSPLMSGRSTAEPLVVDFLTPSETAHQRSVPIAEATVVAMYFNNRAAELLVAGDTAAAYWHAREALRHDPRFVGAANTLGVVHQRAGLADAAEAAFRHVLAAEPQSTAALGNLLGLLQAQGRKAEAEPVAARLAALEPVPPLHWLRLGREALAAGDAALALTLLKRELRRQPEQDDVHLALAEAHLRLGNLAQSQHHLAQAAAHTPRQADQQRYAAKLARLRAGAGAAALR